MRRTILLADDSVTIRKIVELTFGDSDIRVESVGSGREAIDRLREIKPDLVLADVVMPGPSGYDVCRAVKQSERPVPVLLLAGTFEPFDARQARECGSDGHVTKPFDSRALIERVQALLAPGRAAAARPAPGPVEDDLEAMFDDLAQPERPGMIDTRPAPAAPGWAAPSAEAGPIEDDPPTGPEPAPSADGDLAPRLSQADIDAIARAVVAKLSDTVLREIAWDVVPDLAEIVVRERIRELERDDRESS